ncbi:hypothetical protein JZ751_016381 [Albula glossodonta]|uniref:Uncharacterized protein n=1 Tax=Albula glossodonta TaxID=121402 RepID=A0A8T2NS35_9TELE|nr:hypothetical protein JZ751_016381 [Albula glossodonta]
MELQIAEKSGAPEQPAKCRSSVHCDQFKTTDSVLVKQINVGLWEDGELNAEQEETPEEPSGMKGECADMEARRTEPLLIKEERLEEDSVVLGEMNIREKSK